MPSRIWSTPQVHGSPVIKDLLRRGFRQHFRVNDHDSQHSSAALVSAMITPPELRTSNHALFAARPPVSWIVTVTDQWPVRRESCALRIWRTW
jgi:hypothetical protein